MTDYSNWTLQRIFNKVAKHLINQSKRAVTTNGECELYVEKTGARCAYGCLLPVSFYKKHSIMKWWAFINKSGINKYDNDGGLMDKLMECHDIVKPSRWPARLRVIAREFQLEIPEFLK